MNKQKTSRIYALRDPDTNKIRFIGCTDYAAEDKARLLVQQCRFGGAPNPWMGAWIRRLHHEGKKPLLEILEESPIKGRLKYWRHQHKDTLLHPNKGLPDERGSKRTDKDGSIP